MRAIAVAGLAALVLVIAMAVAAAIDVQRFDVDALAKRVPERTALMLQREREARARGRRYRIDQRWVPYASIAPTLRHAVLVAEDDRFFLHGGLDWEEIRASARRNLESGRIVRGGSTITQQLAKNLFLGDRRTLDRKLREVLLAARLERALSKRRILELYLNLIEWGDGVYGAEAAARHAFGISATELDPREAVLLAAIIISPRRYHAAEPSRRIEQRARTIAKRLWRRGALSEAEYRLAIGEPVPPAGIEGLAGGLFGDSAEGAPEAPADTMLEAPVSPGDSVSLPAPP